MEDLDRMEKEIFILSYASANKIYNIAEYEASKIDTIKNMYLIMNQKIILIGNSLKEVMDFLLETFEEVINNENTLGFFEVINPSNALNIIYNENGIITSKTLFSDVVKNFGKTSFNIKNYLFKKFNKKFINARRFSVTDNSYLYTHPNGIRRRCYLKEDSINKLSDNLKILSYDVFLLTIKNEDDVLFKYSFIFNTNSGDMLKFVRKNKMEKILLEFLSKELKNIGFDKNYESLSAYEKDLYEKELFDILDELTDEEKLYLNII